jgi:hypothetical protein
VEGLKKILSGNSTLQLDTSKLNIPKEDISND